MAGELLNLRSVGRREGDAGAWLPHTCGGPGGQADRHPMGRTATPSGSAASSRSTRPLPAPPCPHIVTPHHRGRPVAAGGEEAGRRQRQQAAVGAGRGAQPKHVVPQVVSHCAWWVGGWVRWVGRRWSEWLASARAPQVVGRCAWWGGWVKREGGGCCEQVGRLRVIRASSAWITPGTNASAHRGGARPQAAAAHPPTHAKQAAAGRVQGTSARRQHDSHGCTATHPWQTAAAPRPAAGSRRAAAGEGRGGVKRGVWLAGGYSLRMEGRGASKAREAGWRVGRHSPGRRRPAAHRARAWLHCPDGGRQAPPPALRQPCQPRTCMGVRPSVPSARGPPCAISAASRAHEIGSRQKPGGQRRRGVQGRRRVVPARGGQRGERRALECQQALGQHSTAPCRGAAGPPAARGHGTQPGQAACLAAPAAAPSRARGRRRPAGPPGGGTARCPPAPPPDTRGPLLQWPPEAPPRALQAPPRAAGPQPQRCRRRRRRRRRQAVAPVGGACRRRCRPPWLDFGSVGGRRRAGPPGRAVRVGSEP